MIDGFSIFAIGLLAPLLQLVSFLGLITQRQRYKTRHAPLKFVYASGGAAIIPWITYITFGGIVLDLLAPIADRANWLILLWASLSVANRVILPIVIGLTLLPPYPPHAWLPLIYRLSVVAMAAVASYLTQSVFPINWPVN